MGGGFFDGVCVFWGVHVGPAVFGVSEDEVGCDGVFLEGPGGEGGYFLSFAVVEFELVGVEVAFGGGFCGGVGVGVDGGDGVVMRRPVQVRWVMVPLGLMLR